MSRLSHKEAQDAVLGTQLIKLVIQGETVSSAAEELGLSKKQARRILDKPDNQMALRAALQTMRVGAIETARARMEQLAPRAVEWLVEVGEGDDAHAKVKAAAQILDRNRGTQRGQVYSVGPAEQIDAMSDVELMEKAQQAALVLKQEANKQLAQNNKVVETDAAGGE